MSLENLREVFSALANRDLSEIIYQSQVGGVENKEEMLMRCIENQIFPPIEEDYEFHLRTWNLVSEDFKRYYVSATHDGGLFLQLMENELSLLGFLEQVYDKKILYRYRKKLFRRCFKIATANKIEVRGEVFELLENIYKQDYSAVYTRKFYTENAEEYQKICNEYYENIGYTFRDGDAFNKGSSFVLSREGKIPCVPSTFNICLFPWELEESINLERKYSAKGKEDLSSLNHERERLMREREGLSRSFGWTSFQLIEQLSKKGISMELLQTKSKMEFISMYRRVYGTDGYIDWDMVYVYRFISRKNLEQLALANFKVHKDVISGESYKEVVNRLKIMSHTSLEIEKKAKDILENERGKIKGKTLVGSAYIFRSEAEAIDKSFWYPNYEGNMRLMVRGNPIPHSLIVTTYDTFLWAFERRKEMSLGYFIWISQKLGIWNVIKKSITVLNSVLLSKKIKETLEKLSDIYLKQEQERM